MQKNQFYSIYISITFLIKILFIISSGIETYYKYKNNRLIKKNQINTKANEYKENQKIIFYTQYYKKHFEFIFTILMALLIIYLFNPLRTTTPFLTHHTKQLFFLFALLLITTANWSIFFKEPSYFIEFQEIIGKSPSTKNNT
jgi:hypothetical protein